MAFGNSSKSPKKRERRLAVSITSYLITRYILVGLSIILSIMHDLCVNYAHIRLVV